MLNELSLELKSRGANVVIGVDISTLQAKENRGYYAAILIGIALKPSYIYRLSKENNLDCFEFLQKEAAADKLAEWAADFIRLKGYKAYAQSESNLINGFYDAVTKATPLPHKKIAVLAGLGWIGKSNLLVTQEYGSALCMCSVLTNAPLPIQYRPIMRPFCGKCNVCKDICPAKVIHGMNWEEGTPRDLIVDVYHCETCLKCLVHCVWTQKYVKTHGL
ncbi:epoxyqueuosine reductase [Anoxybacterium hadale]|uniref:Epoxyqueuosine reductase n=1 Tax=Anoxybacterium hadale TaxID=3408580 RepID=A0ACD1A662_9FIRM|nr:epoxyqueuosine reductase [Clostridiales bacterium]